MCPVMSKKDEDVMLDVQKWLDEIKELVAMGQEELGVGYKITALKMIATDKIRKDLETEERYCTRDGRSEDFIWDRLYQMTMNISKDDYLHKRG